MFNHSNTSNDDCFYNINFSIVNDNFGFSIDFNIISTSHIYNHNNTSSHFHNAGYNHVYNSDNNNYD